MRCIGGLYGFNRPFFGSLSRETTHRSASWICELRRHSLQCQVQSRSYFGMESQPPKTISPKSAMISRKLPTPTIALISDTTNIGQVHPRSCRGFLRFFSGNSPAEPELGERAVVERGVVSPPRTVPDHIPKTPYYATGIVPPTDSNVSTCQCCAFGNMPGLFDYYSAGIPISDEPGPTSCTSAFFRNRSFEKELKEARDAGVSTASSSSVAESGPRKLRWRVL